ncbi:MAG TPA: suppressor of fused domain protein [Kofleriaceae bacterium]|nr:suppressor of fused domain protein [Kofleriaceae bacterium]
MANDNSPGGSKIYRHQETAASDGHVADADTDAIVAHLAAKIGKVDGVWHEIVSDKVHIDVHFIPPHGDDNVWTLFTTGMSARPMTTPPGFDGPQRGELILRLPADWPLTQEAFADEKNYWPVRWLKMLARLPHDYNTWLWPSHTIPNGDPAKPLSSVTKQNGMMIVPATCLDDGDEIVTTSSGPVMLMGIMPLYPEEMQFKLEHGYDALIEKLVAADIDDVIAINRVNVCR